MRKLHLLAALTLVAATAVAAVVAAPGAPQALASEYKMIELPKLHGSGWSEPKAINTAGVIVGSSNHRAVRWVNQRLERMPAITGEWGSAATDINDNGVAVGAIWSQWGVAKAVQWNGTSGSFLAPEYPHQTWANAVNNRGVAVGWAKDAAGIKKPVKFVNGEVHFVGRFGETGELVAVAEDSLPVVVGVTPDQEGAVNPRYTSFVYGRPIPNAPANTPRSFGKQMLGAVVNDPASTRAMAIDAEGLTIVGYAEAHVGGRVWRRASATSLFAASTSDFRKTAISPSGRIIAAIFAGTDNWAGGPPKDYRAILEHGNFTVHLRSPERGDGSSLPARPTAVNNDGDVVGVYVNGDVTTAVIWLESPSSIPTSSPAPTPSN